jgi:hypothetical protein
MRTKPAVLKTPFLSEINNPDEYYYNLLVLYFPFRFESTILNGYDNVKQALLDMKNQIENINQNQNCLVLLKKQIDLQKAIEKIVLLNEMETTKELINNINQEANCQIQEESFQEEIENNIVSC